MFFERMLFRHFCKKGDKRMKKIARIPDDIVRRVDIPYGNHGKWNLLDVYYPVGTDKPLATIVNVHGGGYVYGTKNESQYYCMDLAQRGFTVVNFSYRLAPKISYPMPVIETNQVMKWVCANADSYFIDLSNIFMIGDSAGAQIASQYAVVATNPEYAMLFDIAVPEFQLKAVALNCGMYDNFHEIKGPMPGLLHNYFGKNPDMHGEKIHVFKHITKDYPPAYVMAASKDFLLPYAKPMYDRLQELGVESIYTVYGSDDQDGLGHVFHIDIFSDVARLCTDDEAAFFRQYVV